MGLISILFQNPATFFILAVLLLISLIAHEVSHGWVALLFGDETAKKEGRLTLNPILHLDPLGTFLLFVIGFGWARPVPVNYAALSNRRLGSICVALAGCAANILLALLALYGHRKGIGIHSIHNLLPTLARVNIMLAAFNLIPIPPLDGSKVLMLFLSDRQQRNFTRLEPYGLIILIVLVLTGLLNPMIYVVQKIVLTLVALG